MIGSNDGYVMDMHKVTCITQIQTQSRLRLECWLCVRLERFKVSVLTLELISNCPHFQQAFDHRCLIQLVGTLANNDVMPSITMLGGQVFVVFHAVIDLCGHGL